MSQILGVKTISKLINEKFYIPKYQRGYRWDETQVKALLDDITKNKKDENYCLQPLLFQKMKMVHGSF